MNIDNLLKKLGKKKEPVAGKIAAGAFIGTALGAIGGLLFSPKSGKENREDLAKGAKVAVDTAKKSVNEVKEKVEKYAEKIKPAKEEIIDEDPQ